MTTSNQLAKNDKEWYTTLQQRTDLNSLENIQTNFKRDNGTVTFLDADLVNPLETEMKYVRTYDSVTITYKQLDFECNNATPFIASNPDIPADYRPVAGPIVIGFAGIKSTDILGDVTNSTGPIVLLNTGVIQFFWSADPTDDFPLDESIVIEPYSCAFNVNI